MDALDEWTEQWAAPPVAQPCELSALLWSPDAAPEATALRNALCGAGPPDGRALEEYERLWFGKIAPAAGASPWEQEPAFCWRPAEGEARLWVRCFLFESVMLARARGALLLAGCRSRPAAHPSNAEPYASAAAAFAAAAAWLAGWANLPPRLHPALSVQENDSCARLAEALHHACRLAPSGGDAAAWRAVHALCAAHGDAGIRPVGLALRRAGLAAHAAACAAAAEVAATANDYPDACALAARAAEDARAAGASARAQAAYARRLEALRFALARVWPGAKEPPFSASMLPPPSVLQAHGGRYPETT